MQSQTSSFNADSVLYLVCISEGINVAEDKCSQTAFDSCMSLSLRLLFGVVRFLSTSVALEVRNRTTDGVP